MIDARQRALLLDVLDSARQIQNYLQGFSREAFFASVEKQDAVLRRFEIMGEAASRLTEETQAKFPSVPFRAMRGMRNIIAHDYGDVDLSFVWKTVCTDLPSLVEALERDDIAP